ncbi:hypothetical protein SAMN04487969_10198 [Paenibacillus algorifonticola]|uniref:Uncharacterized protein n=1 Tax=Paenibacillus algorifonticola TaxID=684063 RepID=A0A1I1XW52_9BACL|nr:hypothetical protein [Paenibacillus algorifonticola]SFE10918.1 hypothetical protein SAMN04487969_10198 [Paenibacillus algorifonticola]
MAMTWRRYDLQRMRWRLINYPHLAEPDVLPAALDWLDGEIAAMKKAATDPTP